MKKLLITIIVIVLILLLTPMRGQFKDGGTVHYDAILYDVYDVHRINSCDDPNNPDDDFVTGIIVKIFGLEVFNNTTPHIDW